jgi:hypothetical protein
MRVGDFGVELIPVRDGEVRETEAGHVLARHGTVYAIRLRNYGPLRCVAEVRIDDKPVTAGGVVIAAYGAMTLERPVDDGETGRFTVIAEGDERVFGPDGGRDNEALGCIEVSFRRELPRSVHRAPSLEFDDTPRPLPIAEPPKPSIPSHPSHPSHPSTPPGRPMAPPEWTPPSFSAMGRGAGAGDASTFPLQVDEPGMRYESPLDQIERAAGTGLTGRSMQEFQSVMIGPLEDEATVIRLRLVIGTDEAFVSPRPLPDVERAPARPAARP